MKKNLIYFVIFLAFLLLFGNFVSAQEKVTFGVDSALFIKSDDEEVLSDSFNVIFNGNSSVEFVDLTSKVIRNIDLVSFKDSSPFDIPTGEIFTYYSYYGRLDSVEPVIFACVKDDNHKLFSVGIINEKKEYVIIFLLRNRKVLKGITN